MISPRQDEGRASLKIIFVSYDRASKESLNSFSILDDILSVPHFFQSKLGESLPVGKIHMFTQKELEIQRELLSLWEEA